MTRTESKPPRADMAAAALQFHSVALGSLALASYLTDWLPLLWAALGLSMVSMFSARLAVFARLHALFRPGVSLPVAHPNEQVHRFEEGIGHIGFLRPALPAIRHHHERFDGRGYPDGLSGEEIPLEARILAVADSYDAMTSSRPYRTPFTHEEAAAELRRCDGTQFDPHCVEAFLTVLGVEGELVFDESCGGGDVTNSGPADVPRLRLPPWPLIQRQPLKREQTMDMLSAGCSASGNRSLLRRVLPWTGPVVLTAAASRPAAGRACFRREDQGDDRDGRARGFSEGPVKPFAVPSKEK